MRVIDDLLADIRYAVRGLRRSPAFMLAAVVSLALGIGANTAIFSLLDAVLLRSLPVRHPEQLVVFAIRTPARDPMYSLSFNLLETFRAETRTLSAVAAHARARFDVQSGAGPGSTVTGELVSGNYFTLLGVPAAIGRTILPEDDGAPGTGAVAVLSYGFWQRRFGGDSRIVNSTIRLNGQPFTVVGVSAPEFFGTHLGEAPEVRVPLSMQLQVSTDVDVSWIQGPGADTFWLELIGRRSSNVTEPQARADIDAIFQRQVPSMIAKMGPKAGMLGKPRMELEPGNQGLSELRRRFSRPLAVLMAVVALVLLISCANVANLLLARSAARRREIAIRVSLGAARGRLIRQSLTESVLLALMGGAVGLLFAKWAGSTIAALLAGAGLQAPAAPLDPRVLGFTAAASLVTGLVFGVAPAILATQIDPQVALAGGGRHTAGPRLRHGVGRWLVAAQVAISLVLLVGAGLFVRTLVNLHALDLGLDREHVLTVRLEPRGSNQKRPHFDRLHRLYSDLADNVAAIPGVRSASLSGVTPLGSENPLSPTITVPGYVPRPDEDLHIRMVQIFPGYFATLGVPLVAGREFSPADNVPDAPRRAIINETMAHRFFGGASAVGRTFTDGSGFSITQKSGGVRTVTPNGFEIIGVARDVRDRGPRDEVPPTAYGTFAHVATGRGQMTLLVRTTGDPHLVASAVRTYVAALDPGTPTFDVETVAERVDASIAGERMVALLAALFGGLAVLLACVGLYGVMAYAVARRGAEFGIRMALGADAGRVRRLVLGESLALVAAGGVAGLLISAAGVTLLKRMLFGLEPWDPISFAAAGGILVTAACLASYLPARHASRVDPMIALRQD